MEKRNNKICASLIRALLFIFTIISVGYFTDIGVAKAQTNAVQSSNVKFVDVEVAGRHCLALDDKGHLWAWGNNDVGQLGTEDTISKTVPTIIKPEKRFISISAKQDASLVVDSNGTAWTFGKYYNETNPTINWVNLSSYGKVKKAELATPYNSTNFRAVLDTNNDLKFYDVGVKVDATIKNVKDFNFYDFYNLTYIDEITGRVGMGSSKGNVGLMGANIQQCLNIESASTISCGLNGIEVYDAYSQTRKTHNLTNIKSVNAYQASHIAVYYAINNDGQLYSWGSNRNLLLGKDSSNIDENVATPQIISQNKFRTISVAYYSAAAIDEFGRLWSWGMNDHGQLGVSSGIGFSAAPVLCDSSNYTEYNIDAQKDTTYNGQINIVGATNFKLNSVANLGTFKFDIADNGSFTYLPTAYGHETLKISYVIEGSTFESIININMNAKPVFAGNITNYTVQQGVPLNFKVNATDEGDNLTYSILKQGAKGVATIDKMGVCEYKQLENVGGSDSLTISVTDGKETAELKISININTKITHNANTNFTINNIGAFTNNINAIDLDGDKLLYSVKSQANKGNVTIDNNGVFVYTPIANQFGNDTFVITIDDGEFPLDVKYTVTLQILKDDATEVAFRLCKNSFYEAQINTINFGGNNLEYTLSSSPLKGAVTIFPTGKVKYNANQNEFGVDNFSVTVSNGAFNFKLNYSVNINSAPDNLVNKNYVVNENGTLTDNMTTTDFDKDTLVYSIVKYSTKGTVHLNELDGTFNYDALRGYAGDDSFVVRVSDGLDFIEITANVHIECVIQVANNMDLIVRKDEMTTSNPNATDKDGDVLTYSIHQQPIKGIVIINSQNGDFSYVASAEFGTDIFVIKIDDGVKSVLVNCNIKINRAPTIDSKLISLTTTGKTIIYQINATDLDANALTYAISETCSKGLVYIDSASGVFNYSPKPNNFGDDMFKVTITDGFDSIIVVVYIHIESEIDISNVKTEIEVNKEIVYLGNINAVDLDGDKLQYVLKQNALNGELVVNIDGNYTYNLTNNNAKIDSFVVTINDGVKSVDVKILVTVNTFPVVSNKQINASIDLNGTYIGKIVATDADADVIVFTIKTNGAKGIAQIDTNGNFNYISSGVAGNDTVVFLVSDGNYLIEVMFNVHIESNVEFSEATYNYIVKANELYNGNVKAIDLDGDAITYSIHTNATKGTIKLDSKTGAFVFDANKKDIAGYDFFIISATDGNSEALCTVKFNIKTAPTLPNSIDHVITKYSEAISGNISVIDLDNDKLSFIVKTAPIKGNITLNVDSAEYVYTPYTGEYGEDKIVFIISDSDSNMVEYTLIITNKSVPELEKTYSHKTMKNTKVSGKIEFTDKDGDIVKFKVKTNGEKGNITIDNILLGSYTYTPYKDVVGSDECIIEVYDGTFIIDVAVTIEIKTKPILATVEETLKIGYGGKIEYLINASDEDGDPLCFTISTIAKYGVVDLNTSTGSFIYTLSTDKIFEQDYFAINVSDGEFEKNIEIKVNFVEPPLVKDSTCEVKQGKSYLGKVESESASPLSYSVNAQGNKGVISIDSNTGEFTYVANFGSSGQDAFVIEIFDGYNTITKVVNVSIDSQMNTIIIGIVASILFTCALLVGLLIMKKLRRE